MKALIALCLVLFIDSIGQGLVFPILPDLFLNSRYGLCIGYTLNFTNFIYGFSLSVPLIFGLLSMPIFGSLSDTFGRKHLILIGLSGILGSYIIAVIAILYSSLWLFVLSRVIVGCCIGTYTVVYASISDLDQDEVNKMNNYRWPTVAYVMGFIIGPAIGGSASFSSGVYAYFIPFGIGGGLTLLNVFLGIWFIQSQVNQNTNKQIRPFKLIPQIIQAYQYTFRLLKQKSVKSLFIQTFLLQFAVGLYIQSLSLYLSELFQLKPMQLGFVFIVIGVGLLISSIWLQPFLLKKIPLNALMHLCLSIIAILFGLQWFITIIIDIKGALFLIYLSLTASVLYMFFSMATNGYIALLSGQGKAEDQGKMMSSIGQISMFSFVPAGLLIGYLVPNHALWLLSICCLAVLFALIGYKPKMEIRTEV